MTYNVFGGTLNPTLPMYLSTVAGVKDTNIKVLPSGE